MNKYQSNKVVAQLPKTVDTEVITLEAYMQLEKFKIANRLFRTDLVKVDNEFAIKVEYYSIISGLNNIVMATREGVEVYSYPGEGNVLRLKSMHTYPVNIFCRDIQETEEYSAKFLMSVIEDLVVTNGDEVEA